MNSFNQDLMKQMVSDHQGEFRREAENQRMLRDQKEVQAGKGVNFASVLRRLFAGLTRPGMSRHQHRP
ncbi:MAG: hypothetical protein R6X18_15825 [Chloroflexota bacterium]